MVYSYWLFGLSLLFLLLERWRPFRPQPLRRQGFLQDLVYLVFYGEYWGLLLGMVTIHLLPWFDTQLHLLPVNVFSTLPLWAQIPLLILLFDLVQWCVHVLMHRVPWLWEFHKLHHSSTQMDWLSNWRFHWVEVLVYRAALYVPAAICGFDGAALFAFGVFNTAAGHFAHSNLAFDGGLLRYVLNTPGMHRWHHAHPDAGPLNRNFGIGLSLWDWLFGTAYLPKQQSPARLGFTDVEAYPKGLLKGMVAPFLAFLRPAGRAE